MEKIFEWLLHILDMPKIKFTMKHRFTIFRHPYKKTKMAKSSQISTTNQQYHHFESHHPKNCIKSIPYTLARRIHTVITDKNLKKTRLKELPTTLNQRVPTTLINKLAKKIPQR